MTTRREQPACTEKSQATCDGLRTATRAGGLLTARESDLTWLAIADAAPLLGCSRRHLYRRLAEFTTREMPRGNGSAVCQVALESLPADAQARYYQIETVAPLTSVEQDPRVRDIEARAATPEWARGKADEKLAAIAAVREFRAEHTGLGKIVAIKKFCSGQPYHWQTLNRWLAAYAAHGYQGIVDGYGNRAGDSLLTAADRKVLHEVYVLAGGSKAHAFERLAKLCRRDGREVPSTSTVNRVLGHFDVARARAYHAGPDSFNADYEPHSRLDYESLRPLDWSSGDHHRIDCFVRVVRKRDPQTGRPVKWALVRPWLTAFLDDKSKRFIGWHIVADQAPNHLTIHQAFYTMVTECGVPRRVKFDNGKDFLHRHFIGGTDHQKFRRKRRGVKGDVSELPGVMVTLGVKFTAVRKYHGASKRIERAFKEVVGDWAKKWPTYCGKDAASVPEKSERARKQAMRELVETGTTRLVPTLDELVVDFADWVDFTYHQTPQHGHGMNGRTPMQVWNDEVHDKPVTKLTATQVHYLLMKRKRAVARDGIEFHEANYWADEIAGDVRREVIIAWDPADLSKLYVSHVDGTPLCIARRDKRSSQFRDDGQHREMRRRRKLVKSKARELEGARRSLAEQEIALREHRDDARVEDPDEPESPRQIKPLFGAAADAISFFETYEQRAAVPDVPASPPPANLVGDAFKSVRKPALAPEPHLVWDDFYHPKEEDDDNE
ncbi:MAG: transposase [Candidatus Lernaella stagnicola]|nr:transposase [Candidatus Lernaella stagnicola]